ncbi:MAG: type IV secretory system conjugative DNA transfer family protein, partial [Pseudomonadota bacterium]
DLEPAPTTIYIVIPPQSLRDYRGVMRMMTGLAVAELTRAPMWSGLEGWARKPPCDVLFLLDELPILGHMPPIVNGLAYLAGYDIQIWSFAQNIGQLKSVYGDDWQNFTANAGAISFFGVNDPDTADYVVRLLGETEEYAHTYYTSSESSSSGTTDTKGYSDSSGSSYSGYRSDGSGSSNSSSSGFSSSESSSTSNSQTTTENTRFVREPIAQAAEIRAIRPDLQLVFFRNNPPIIATKMPFYDFPLFSELYDTWSS